jgi:hypothetical protein
MILARLWHWLLRRSQDARTVDAAGLTSLRLRGLPEVAIYGLAAPAAPQWPRCGCCGTIYGERGHHPALGKLIVKQAPHGEPGKVLAIRRK